MEAIFYDLRAKFDFGMAFKDNIVLVLLDEESDQFLGETYPYTYASHSRMIEKLLKDKPKAIGYLVNLLEPETDTANEFLDKFKLGIKRFEKEGGVFNFGIDMDAWGKQLPPEDLREFGYQLALINVDNAAFAKDDVSRRAILNASGEDAFHLEMSNLYRKMKGEDMVTAANVNGSYYVREADATFVMFRYYSSTLENKGKVKRIPFHMVRVGNFPKGFFQDKIVLVGPSYISNSFDYVLTPFDKENFSSSKMMIHAQIIQSLVQEKTVIPLPKTFSYAICIIIAIFLSLLISRVKPTYGLLITVGLMIGIIVLSFALYSLFGLWIYLSHIVLTIFVVYYIWVPFRAIGEYQRRFAIQEETKLIKKVENLKQNFISLMSHDLKTPVAKIAGLADMILREKGAGPDFERNVAAIKDSTKELNSFITSILDLTKVESRNLSINLVSKDINRTIETVVESLRYEAVAKNVTVETKLSPLYPISFDLKLMTRVLSNLIENAIKYSGENTKVSVESWDDEKWVTIKITDNGVGIPADDLEYIFDKFYRVKNDASHSIKGTGLGLFLVKYFVELHGGQIKAESELGQGTSFTVTLKNE